MIRRFLSIFLAFIAISLQAQIVQLTPSNATDADEATLVFDASQGNAELMGAASVYIHHGVVTDGPNGTSWQNVIGNWGMDDGVGKMTKVSGETDKWEITFSPSIREYFNVPEGTDIFRISMVFRSPDGNTKGTTAAGSYSWGQVTSNLDMYYDLNVPTFVQITSPTENEIFVDAGNTFNISAEASNTASIMRLLVDDGTGFVEQTNVSNTNLLSYDYAPTASGDLDIKVTAVINGESVETNKSVNVIVRNSTNEAPLPDGVIAGINYNPTDDTKATLVLQAPGKSSAYVVGDMTNWVVDDDYQMNQTPDKEYFWLEINNLTPGQPYVFQYWVDDNIKIGDPYSELVVDPWNDQFIDASVFPNIPPYDKTEFGIATVLQTAQPDFVWDASESTWVRPDVDHIVIYELLIRDFIATHDWKGLQDTLDYIKNLGVDAIEIMPFNEFEGNESWGYNPSYFFAPDKYYGTGDDIRRFVQTCHQNGIAVIMDIVLNHAYDQCALVQLYFNNATGNPTADNPWFNESTVGQFEFGNDFNHEEQRTKDFIDRVNAFWIEEYHIDGYRFDFTKGFTQHAPGGNLDGYDQSRIDIVSRMADTLWAVHPDAYVILEHFGQPSEETALGNLGMKMWGNRSYDYVPQATGAIGGAFTDMDRTTHVQYFDSHDERRIADHVLTEGRAEGNYNTRSLEIMYERVKQAAAFGFLFPGPKLMWQFDELGYDINIDFNGRVGNKPLPWGTGGLGYYEDPLRQYIYDTYQGILDVRKKVDPVKLKNASTSHLLSGAVRRLSYNTDDIDLVVIGNFGLNDNTIDPMFSQTGWWYDYFSGDSLMVDNTSATQNLRAGEWHIYTTQRLGEGVPGAVEIFDNPVTISPTEFTKNDMITITFDAKKAWRAGTNGLVGASKVYFHSGVVLESPTSTILENVVGNLVDDGVGEMTSIGNDVWEITLTLSDYYNISSDQDVFRLGMYFRDAANVNLGKGFRDQDIYFNVQTDEPFITITPSDFDIDSEITITFNALQGNRELVGASKVYVHSSVDLTDTETPHNSAWNNTIGNWGMDDGVGQMTKVSGETDKWEIKLIPRQYYGLNDGDHVFWWAGVFRSADGNTKGTGTPGELPNGYIHTNQDFFIRNLRSVGLSQGLEKDQEINVFPNPVSDELNIELIDLKGEIQLEIFDITGRQLSQQKLNHGFGGYLREKVALPDINPGMYVLRITGDSFLVVKEFIKLGN